MTWLCRPSPGWSTYSTDVGRILESSRLPKPPLSRVVTWAHRVQATAIYTVDGSRKAVKIGWAMEVRSARAAVRHDGLVLGSRLHEEHEGHDQK